MRGPDKPTIDRARHLRRADNDAEAALWSELRNRRLNDFKFVRQLPVGRYFADFACRDVRLVVEIDGHQHAGSIYDRMRDDYMCGQGWNVARFWNMSVLKEREAVMETIVAIAEGRLTEAVSSRDLVFRPARDV